MEAEVAKLLSNACVQCSDDGVVDPRVLETALLMSTLSTAVFDEKTVHTVNCQTAEYATASVANQRIHFKPIFSSQHSKLQKPSTESVAKGGNQYGFWEIPGLGVVLAFKGLPNLQDELANLSCDCCELQSEPQLHLNASIYQAVQPCCKNIALACQDLCCKGTAGPLPLFVTGNFHDCRLCNCCYCPACTQVTMS